MTTFASSRLPTTTILTAAFFAAPVLAFAHETGAPHGMAEHAVLYLGAAGLLAIAGFALIALTQGRAAKRVRIRVERDDPRRSRDARRR